jgi:hypothetical protein
VALVYRELVAADALTRTQQAVREQMERGPLRALFAWTGEKVALWTHLTHHLGLARRLERSAEVLIVPRPDLVLAALCWATRQDPVGTHSLRDALDAIDRSLFACYTSRGRVHGGLAQALSALEHAGQVQITHSADAARSLLVGERRASEVRLRAAGDGT